MRQLLCEASDSKQLPTHATVDGSSKALSACRQDILVMPVDVSDDDGLTPEEREQERAAKEEKMKKIVAQTPGATIFQEGMKVPGQEEREQLDVTEETLDDGEEIEIGDD